jgi:hypothetical protein
MRKQSRVLIVALACLIFTAGVVAAEPVKSADDALNTPTVAVDQLSKEQADLEIKAADNKAEAKAADNKAEAKAKAINKRAAANIKNTKNLKTKLGAMQKADTAAKDAIGAKAAPLNDSKELQK